MKARGVRKVLGAASFTGHILDGKQDVKQRPLEFGVVSILQLEVNGLTKKKKK